MKKITILLITILFTSCTASQRAKIQQRKAERKKIKAIEKLNELVDKNPTLLNTEIDTFARFRIDTFYIKAIEYDTIIRLDLQNKTDTIIIENERVKTEIIRVPNFITNENEYQVNQEVKPDSIFVPVIDTFVTIKERLTTEYVIEEKIPFWVWIVFIILALSLFLILLK